MPENYSVSSIKFENGKVVIAYLENGVEKTKSYDYPKSETIENREIENTGRNLLEWIVDKALDGITITLQLDDSGFTMLGGDRLLVNYVDKDGNPQIIQIYMGVLGVTLWSKNQRKGMLENVRNENREEVKTDLEQRRIPVSRVNLGKKTITFERENGLRHTLTEKMKDPLNTNKEVENPAFNLVCWVFSDYGHGDVDTKGKGIAIVNLNGGGLSDTNAPMTIDRLQGTFLVLPAKNNYGKEFEVFVNLENGQVWKHEKDDFHVTEVRQIDFKSLYKWVKKALGLPSSSLPNKTKMVA
ncbi:MAG: hypothetical protein N3E51_00565 [Candidatus Micrarchaeota archaeon]|nr:hypothetical protein [Candidatus Micrarchaeota archaeon]